MIARTEEEIRDRIEELSYIFDISDDLRIRYERSRLDVYPPHKRTKKSHLYPLQYDDYIVYGQIIALEWTIGLRDTLETVVKKEEDNRHLRAFAIFHCPSFFTDIEC